MSRRSNGRMRESLLVRVCFLLGGVEVKIVSIVFFCVCVCQVCLGEMGREEDVATFNLKHWMHR